MLSQSNAGRRKRNEVQCRVRARCLERRNVEITFAQKKSLWTEDSHINFFGSSHSEIITLEDWNSEQPSPT